MSRIIFSWVAGLGLLFAAAPLARGEKGAGSAPAASDASEATPRAVSLRGTRNVHRAGDVLLAGQPSEEAFEELAESGFKTVISLRHPAEERFDEAAVCERLGMKFVRLPINNPDDLNRELIQTACALLKTASPQAGVVLHCAGANRVGAVWLALRIQEDGLSVQEARQEAARVGLKTPSLEQQALRYAQPGPPSDSAVTPPPVRSTSRAPAGN